MWTVEDDLRLLDMQHRGLEVSSIATRLKRQADSCTSRLQLLHEEHLRNSSQRKYALSEFRLVNLCVLCPDTRVKYLIGRNHHTIESIKKKTKASFSIHSSELENMEEVKESIVIISATERCQGHSCVEDAATLALPHLIDYSRGSPSIKLLVEANHCLESLFLFQIRLITKSHFVFTNHGSRGLVLEIWGTDLHSVKKAFSLIMIRLRRHVFILSEEDLLSGSYVDISPSDFHDD